MVAGIYLIGSWRNSCHTLAPAIDGSAEVPVFSMGNRNLFNGLEGHAGCIGN
jgi:hypothetical protein